MRPKNKRGMKEKAEFVLGKTIGKLRGRIYRLQRIRYEKAAVRLTVEESIILNMISEKSNRISQNIVIETGKNKSVVMRMIDSLEEKGLVQRMVNPNDRRENLLTLTESGEKVRRQYYKLEKLLATDLLKNVDEEDVLTFFKVVEQIGENADNMLLHER